MWDLTESFKICRFSWNCFKIFDKYRFSSSLSFNIHFRWDSIIFVLRHLLQIQPLCTDGYDVSGKERDCKEFQFHKTQCAICIQPPIHPQICIKVSVLHFKAMYVKGGGGWNPCRNPICGQTIHLQNQIHSSEEFYQNQQKCACFTEHVSFHRPGLSFYNRRVIPTNCARIWTGNPIPVAME